MKVGMREEMLGCRDLGEYGVCEGREKKNARYTIKKRKCKKRNRKKTFSMRLETKGTEWV